MKYCLVCLLLLPLLSLSQAPGSAALNRWQQQAARVTIIRDTWGIPHVYGKTDADAVFGLMYAQCEDDFKRVEMNYIEKLGRRAEVQGEAALYKDLYIRLLIDSAAAMADYRKAPTWLRQLLQAWADGINYYLHTHPQTKPMLLHQFQPWYPLLWTDGSIGAISSGDISEVDVQRFYSNADPLAATQPTAMSLSNSFVLQREAQRQQDGSNGFAFAPARTSSGNAILYINPHTTFYFRPEVQLNSEEGLRVYGAVTWGQFFIYQGFNDSCGWMHTSSNTDVSDVYRLTLRRQGNRYQYLYEGQWRPLRSQNITLRYQTSGGTASKTFTAWFSHHGPVMAQRNGTPVAVRHNNRSMQGLIQSWLRTKATGLESFKQTMALCSNTSNNTVFADHKGNIAYWHGNFVPRRDASLNWSKVMDGSTASTDWKGVHPWEQTVHVINPATGWIQNCNSTPFTVSGSASPKAVDYPRYMAPDGENFRGINAVRLLQDANQLTLDQVIALGYNRKLSIFEVLLPALAKAYRQLNATDSFYTLLQAPVAVLNNWDYHVSEQSIATTLAVEWAQQLPGLLQRVYIDEGEADQVQQVKQFADTASAVQLLRPLYTVIQKLRQRFGSWEIPWGEINRFQRISGDLQQVYDDAKESQPVPFASAAWGMLPAYNSSYFTGTRRRYGVTGNSFVCAVEFGPVIKAKSVLAGGVSGDPKSPHFKDQLLMYTKGEFKEVLFYKEEVERHAVRRYRPGEGVVSSE